MVIIAFHKVNHAAIKWLAIYIDNRFDYEIIMNLNMCKQWEGLVIKVKGDTLTNPFIICNVYRPPRSTVPVLREFLDELAPVVNSLDMPLILIFSK